MISIVGGGLVGSLLATGLARRGIAVELLERREDIRKGGAYGGRSINLAVSVRGIHALKGLGLAEEVLSRGIPMKGRMMHSVSGELTFQPYGIEDWQCIHSISRAELNRQLLSAAERAAARIEFGNKLTSAKISPQQVRLEFEGRTLDRTTVIGTDGSASVLRREVIAESGSRCSESQLDYGYKELSIPPNQGGGFKMEPHALHIWPRGNFMLIALPNFDGSFTCTLFLPYEGEIGIGSFKTPADVRSFFEKHFSDTLPLIEDLEGSFFSNPTGHMVTVKCSSWNVGGRALLMGDAAHAIVPFFGQGMNSGFEDCSELFRLLDSGLSIEAVFDEMSRIRPANADAIADMAVENFLEMRDRVGDQQFLREKQLEKRLQQAFPKEYISRYSLVSFSRVPYTVAFEAGVAQSRFLADACRPGADPGGIELAALLPRIQSEISPILRAHLPNGLLQEV